MKLSTYQELARRTEKPLQFAAALQHGMLGIITEAGELGDIIKRHVIYEQPIDGSHVMEELGDILWYVALIANNLGVNLDDTAANNIGKLAKRYPDKYTNQLAAERKDKE